MTKSITFLLTALLITSCSNNENQSTKEEFQDENSQEEDIGLNADLTSNEEEFIDIPLDSLLTFHSEDELKEVFGDHVKRSIGYYPEGMGEYNNTLLYPDSKNEVEFIWKDDSLNFNGLSSLKLRGKETDWKTKEGITIGTSMKKLEALNKKPFTFYGLGWDYAGTIDWQEGYLYKRKIAGRLEYPEDHMPSEFDSLLGDREIKSSSAIAQKAKLILAEITMSKIE